MKLSRRNFALGASAAPALLAQRHRRNLIFILSDDHGYNIMSATGHPWIKTPSLDRLAKGGALFQNSFCKRLRTENDRHSGRDRRPA